VRVSAYFLSCLFPLLMAALIGCSPSAKAVHCQGTPAAYDAAHPLPAWQSSSGAAPQPKEQEPTPAERFDCRISLLADQLDANIDRDGIADTFIVTSFTDLSNLSETSALGRLISESLSSRLQAKQWKVYEVRLRKDIIIHEKGEFSLSRDNGTLREMYKAGGMVTGTYALTSGDVMIHARVIDLGTGQVLSTAQSRIPLDLFSETLLHDPSGTRAMKIIGSR